MDKPAVRHKLLSFFNSYFFAEVNPHKLGLIRILLVGLTLLQTASRYYLMHRITSLGPAFDVLHTPSHLLKLLAVPFPLPPELQLPFAIGYYLVGCCAMVGLFTRPALVLFGLANIYVFDVQYATGVFDHEMGLVSQVLLVLAFAPGTMAFSVDRLIGWLLHKKSLTTTQPLYHFLPGPRVPVWGLRLIMILLACTYFTAGFSKIRYGGIQWVDGKTLAHYLNGQASPNIAGHRPIFMGPAVVPADKKWKDGFGIYTYSWGNKQRNVSRMEIGKFIASNRFIITALSIATVIFELSSILLLTSGWPKLLYLVGAIAMHQTIGFLMDLRFLKFQLLCLLLIDWQWVYRTLLSGFNKVVARRQARTSSLG
ncbi:hypothetical protein Q0590_24560 [Rhodocytophaga aerolata]|uniref:HTTM domain-containing protein n=1 Tax=Rhodocytophaga aerolata TaxID=455078 RepID=A0ABT8RCN9_9BACT|nr:hypothetical protein [Rhodocytophaga aerolata]MDO1449471.1 hypothetical protein [Rhodocytophaga aerolata]